MILLLIPTVYLGNLGSLSRTYMNEPVIKSTYEVSPSGRLSLILCAGNFEPLVWYPGLGSA